ncbi:MAG: biopolymer transporter ExbD [Candidatus Abyssobacteria bacterium SURF_5]|uniref:Biopolymer transporter ExbD n=1 Tax=Abyssobacteria bacterium (strain SURF_5) TaxID=2093360 RepID=A0A3A4NZ48_ABYX5|nr:MAG: biopolymer transporter ExbD [Candidatus Abyssubacteria bacterium SURF_5]
MIKVRERRRKKPAINITSLIDVMFLLLIFFMVSTTFAEHPGIKLELPKAKTGEPNTLDPLVLTLTKAGDMFLNDVAVDEEQLRVRLKSASNRPDASLVLRADKDVPYGFVIHAMDISRQCGIRRITSLTDLPQNAGT